VCSTPRIRKDELTVQTVPHLRVWQRLESQLSEMRLTSHNDDRCRVRNHNAMWVLAMMRRLSNSLFMHWRQRKRRPDHVTTTDFQAYLSERSPSPGYALGPGQMPQTLMPS
jgi:hypothetical protein